MLNRIFSLSFVTFFLLGAFTLFGLFSPSLEAQPGEDPNYEYPVLTDKDFQLYLDLLDCVLNNKDEYEYLRKNNITEEYASAVIVKIFANYLGQSKNMMQDIVSTYGKNIVFNGSEAALYDNYQSEIQTVFDKLIETGKAKNNDF
ncbi:MAG: hypothetical protein LBD41_04270 [Clostridiales Family XIII bacterium]|jgi:hypothetical protein|nr:hypothetical protein [Clostridiales Family XIII bacterium]